MITQFYTFIDSLIKENINVNTEIIYDSYQIKTSFIISINKNQFHNTLMEFELFTDKNLSVFVESKIPKDNKHYNDIIAEELDRKGKINILFSHSQEFNLKANNSEEIIIYLYNKPVYIQFIKLIASKFSIKDLSSLKYKINIICNKIFEVEETELFVFNKTNQLISSETLIYIESLRNREASIFTIPNTLPKEMSEEVLKLIIPDILSQLSTNHSNNEYRFIGKRVITFNTENIKQLENSFSIFSNLNETIKFIYEDTKTTDQKLTFYRKTLIDGHLKDEIYDISKLDIIFFDKLYKDAENVYDAFQDDAVSTFIKEKKEIIKEYMSVSKDIISAIDGLKNSLLRNLITLLALIITNIALKSRGIAELSDYIIIYIVSTVFMGVLLFIHIANDLSSKSTIERRLNIFDEHFKFISSSSKELKESIKQTIHTEIKKYDLLLTFVGCLYLLIFIISASLLLNFILK